MDPIVAEVEENVSGVPDQGLDPSVVTVGNARGEACSGVLLAGDVVLTARHCVLAVAEPVDCATPDILAPALAGPATLSVTGTSFATGSSVIPALAILTPSDPALCGADVAVLVLAASFPGAVPVLVSESGVAAGGHVRSVGLGVSTTGGTNDMVREHLSVLDVSPHEIAVAEATCTGAGGSPAYDETTGEVVGVLSRWATACDAGAQYDVFTRSDAFYGLIQQALAWEPELTVIAPDGGVRDVLDAGKKRDAGRPKKPPTDVGAACLSASDCGAGVCVSAEGSQYCSRSCAPDDRCPTDFRCVIAAGGGNVCVVSS